MAPASLSSGEIQYPQSNWAPLVLVLEWVGLGTLWAPVGLSNDLSCEAGNLSCCCPTPTGAFNQRFEALFHCSGALGCVACFAPRRSSGLSMHECGATGSATRCSACPFLRHSESGPLGLSVRECGAAGSASGQTACPVCPTLRQSRCHSNASPLRPGARLRPSYWSG